MGDNLVSLKPSTEIHAPIEHGALSCSYSYAHGLLLVHTSKARTYCFVRTGICCSRGKKLPDHQYFSHNCLSPRSWGTVHQIFTSLPTLQSCSLPWIKLFQALCAINLSNSADVLGLVCIKCLGARIKSFFVSLKGTWLHQSISEGANLASSLRWYLTLVAFRTCAS